jgi:hypothetical protein
MYQKEKFLFDSDKADIVISSLAGGSYSANIIGAGGSAPPTPVHLSRDQDVELLMLGYLDIALIIGIPLSIALAFIFIGRVWYDTPQNIKNWFIRTPHEIFHSDHKFCRRFLDFDSLPLADRIDAEYFCAHV